MKRSSLWLVPLALAVMVSLLLAACGEEEESGGPTPGETAAVSPEASPAASPEASPGAEVQGVTDTEIKFGTHLPLSQTPAAVYAPIGQGITAYFNYINDTEGGVTGRKPPYTTGEDPHTPPDGGEGVRKLVEQDKVFAFLAGLGEPTHFT